jgi:hypothetical protein
MQLRAVAMLSWNKLPLPREWIKILLGQKGQENGYEKIPLV